jgi:hypothetical protein
MVVVTDTAAEVRHGHEKKAGSSTDKPKGALIARYPFAKYGRKASIRRAHATHYAIIKSQERAKNKEKTDHEGPAASGPTASSVATRGAVQTVSIAPKPLDHLPPVGTTVKVIRNQPLGIGSTAPRMPDRPSPDARSDMAIDNPEALYGVSLPPDKRASLKIEPWQDPQDKVLASAEARDEQIGPDGKGLPYGPGSDPSKRQAGSLGDVVGTDTRRLRLPDLLYFAQAADNDPTNQVTMDVGDDGLQEMLIDIFSYDPPEDDEDLHEIAEAWGLEPSVVEEAVYGLLADFLSGGLSGGKDVAVNLEQLKAGIDVEKEHTPNPFLAAKIAKDHLVEDPEYYTKLKTMEHAEVREQIEQPQVGMGLAIDKKGTQMPLTTIKQDGITEGLQRRDAPVYDEDDEDDEDEDGVWVEAFKAGTHTDSDGTTRKWDPGDLSKIVQQYNKTADPKNPDRKVAPVVLGHPKDNSPAYGWVDKVKMVGDKIKAHMTELNGGFKQALKEGAYKTRSISLYPDLNIRHIGFLGGVQPAVAGLGPFKFEEGVKATTYEFAEEHIDPQEYKLMKRELNFFERLFKRFKIEVTPTDHSEPGPQDRVPLSRGVEPGYDKPGIISAKESTMAIEKDTTTAGGTTVVKTVETPAPASPANENPSPQAFADLMKAFTELKGKFEELEKKYAEMATSHSEVVVEKDKAVAEKDKVVTELSAMTVEARKNSFKQFCDGLVGQGRMLPRDVDQEILNLELRYEKDSATKDFSEKKETPSVDAFKNYLEAQPKIVAFEEIATKDSAPVTKDVPDTATERVMKECQGYIDASGGKLSWNEAFKRCMSENPADVQAYIEELK